LNQDVTNGSVNERAGKKQVRHSLNYRALQQRTSWWRRNLAGIIVAILLLTIIVFLVARFLFIDFADVGRGIG
jgi:hypothetical protein